MKAETVNGYGVLIDPKAESAEPFLAYGEPFGPFFTLTYSRAVAHKKELQKQISAKCRVVKVTLTYSYQSQ